MVRNRALRTGDIWFEGTNIFIFLLSFLFIFTFLRMPQLVISLQLGPISTLGVVLIKHGLLHAGPLRHFSISRCNVGFIECVELFSVSILLDGFGSFGSTCLIESRRLVEHGLILWVSWSLAGLLSRLNLYKRFLAPMLPLQHWIVDLWPRSPSQNRLMCGGKISWQTYLLRIAVTRSQPFFLTPSARNALLRNRIRLQHHVFYQLLPVAFLLLEPHHIERRLHWLQPFKLLDVLLPNSNFLFAPVSCRWRTDPVVRPIRTGTPSRPLSMPSGWPSWWVIFWSGGTHSAGSFGPRSEVSLDRYEMNLTCW